jgi:hypothetical protein
MCNGFPDRRPRSATNDRWARQPTPIFRGRLRSAPISFSLRGWRSQERGGSNPPFRMPSHYSSILYKHIYFFDVAHTRLVRASVKSLKSGAFPRFLESSDDVCANEVQNRRRRLCMAAAIRDPSRCRQMSVGGSRVEDADASQRLQALAKRNRDRLCALVGLSFNAHKRCCLFSRGVARRRSGRSRHASDLFFRSSAMPLSESRTLRLDRNLNIA